MIVTYSKSWVFRSHHIRRCVTYRVSGTIYYTAVAMPNPRNPPPEIAYKAITLTDPVLSATVTRYTSAGRCTSGVSLTKLTMGQYWSGYSCSYNPSLSVSWPFGVSVSAWPNCGNKRQAGYTAPYGSYKVYTQWNSGSPTVFANDTVAQGQPAPCYGVYVSALEWVGGSSDSIAASP